MDGRRFTECRVNIFEIKVGISTINGLKLECMPVNIVLACSCQYDYGYLFFFLHILHTAI